MLLSKMRHASPENILDSVQKMLPEKAQVTRQRERTTGVPELLRDVDGDRSHSDNHGQP